MNTQFDKVTKNREVLPGYMLVKENGQDRKVIVADILYVDHSNCYVKIHTEHAIIATCIKFSAVKSFLCAHDAFVSCNRKMVLNMNKIKKVEGLFFLIKNGEYISMGKKREKEIKNRYMDYILGIIRA